jgi:hypothetical protein
MTNQQPTERLSSFPEHFHPDIIEIGGVKYQRVEPPKPQTLYEIIREWNDNEDYPTCEEFVSRIEEWLPTERFEDGEEYYIGWNDCLRQLKEKLK